MREPQISEYIGARMAELHSVDVATIEGSSRGSKVEIGVRKNVQSWLPHARDVVALPAITPAIRKELDLDTFQTKWERYMRWLKDAQVGSRPVFCHNDAQYGNILHLNSAKGITPEHHQVRLP
jgi:choline kinase